MMMYVRKSPKKAELEQYRKWQEQYGKPKPTTPDEARERSERFWQAQREVVARLTAPRTEGVKVVPPSN
jgi:hypothetical protein